MHVKVYFGWKLEYWNVQAIVFKIACLAIIVHTIKKKIL